MFLQPLTDVTAARGGTIKLSCTVKAYNLFWFVNNTWYKHNTADLLYQKGFTFSPLQRSGKIQTGNVSVDAAAKNINNTVLWCIANNNQNKTISSNATLHIAGEPDKNNEVNVM